MFRYSDIIGSVFYNIKLTPRQYSQLDIHFLCASHHYYRSKNIEFKNFHETLMWQHVKELMCVVKSGCFDDAVDTGLDGHFDLSKPESWEFKHQLPHPLMFNKMWEDHRFDVGENHPYDNILEGKPIPIILYSELAA